ncbi:hypothetical protein F2Q68_00033927 [Brassica cretica]|uniref:Uncharacterized protein n=1 Tax=Brassica cretica TaxID=69181 RepID=A0A8S9HC71_BRACR|nr:hypothetical protein F2Q68_00033927 [Brassica cretica]
MTYGNHLISCKSRLRGQPQTRQPNPNGPAEATEYIKFVVASVQNTHGDTTAEGSRTQTTIPEPQRATSRGDADMPDTDFEINEDCLFFPDDEDDDSVDKMVSLIRDGARFTKKMFIGGATSADVERMREEAEAEALAKKKKRRKIPCQTIPTPTQAPVDA